MNAHHRTTFREILEASREEAAFSAWERARTASRLRHAAQTCGNWRAARRLSQIKRDAIQLVAFILPEQLHVTLDSDHHVGLVSVRLQGHGRLHLPANSSIGQAPASSSLSRCCLTMGVAEATATCNRTRNAARSESRLR